MQKATEAQESKFRRSWREHGLPLLFFALLTVALTWPTVRTFTTHYVGQASDDPRHNLWLLWHVKEAMLGHQPLFSAPLLYYPAGISLHLHGVGPLMGVLALPFWPLGPAAAYNGAVLLAFALSGYCMYLLARGLRISRPAALFAGALYSAMPMHLGGLLVHFEKIFTGLLPLTLLATHHALDQKRNRWWAVGVAVLLLLTSLHNGLLFVEAALSVAFFVLLALLRRDRGGRPELWRRLAMMGGSSVLFVGPLLWSTVKAAGHPGIPVDFNLASSDFQPDLLQFFLPPPFSRLFGARSLDFLVSLGIDSHIESWVYLSWSGLLLAAVAVVVARRRVWPWLLLAAGWALLALGPSLQAFGQRTFTEYRLPLILPYAWFTMLPGLDFLRTPGRLMLIGHVGFGVVAAVGLDWLRGKWPQLNRLLVGMAILLVLLEVWPQPWPRQPVRPAPPFYRTLAADSATYGVMDLPIRPPDVEWHASYASRYQLDQMTHGKGIASGYISRPYRTHPLFPCLIPALLPPQPDVLVNGTAAHCYANALHDLAYYDYRYVVWHKPQPDDEYAAEPADVEATSAFLLEQLEGQTPLVDDTMTTVYAVPPLTATTGLSPTMGLLHNWYKWEGEQRWAQSPASLFISTPRPQQARLHLTPAAVYEPDGGRPLGQRGRLSIALDEETIAVIGVTVGQTTTILLDVAAGVHTVTLSLEAGNFRPAEVMDSNDARRLSFAIQRIHLQTGE